METPPRPSPASSSRASRSRTGPFRRRTSARRPGYAPWPEDRPAGGSGARGIQGIQGVPGPIEGVTAGGDLCGTYPNPPLAADSVGIPEIGVIPAVRIVGSGAIHPGHHGHDRELGLRPVLRDRRLDVRPRRGHQAGRAGHGPLPGACLARVQRGTAAGVRTVAIAINGTNSNPACFDRRIRRAPRSRRSSTPPAWSADRRAVGHRHGHSDLRRRPRLQRVGVRLVDLDRQPSCGRARRTPKPAPRRSGPGPRPGWAWPADRDLRQGAVEHAAPRYASSCTGPASARHSPSLMSPPRRLGGAVRLGIRAAPRWSPACRSTPARCGPGPSPRRRRRRAARSRAGPRDCPVRRRRHRWRLTGPSPARASSTTSTRHARDPGSAVGSAGRWRGTRTPALSTARSSAVRPLDVVLSGAGPARGDRLVAPVQGSASRAVR